MLTVGNLLKIISDHKIGATMPIALELDDGEKCPALDQVQIAAVTMGGGEAQPVLAIKGYTKAKRQELREAAKQAQELEDIEDEDADAEGAEDED